MGGLKQRLGRFVEARRRAWGWFDHLALAWARYREDFGDRLAAAVSYYGFLSMFPLLLLGVSVLGFFLAGDPLRQGRVFDAITSNLPGVGDQIAENLSSVAEHRRASGLIGLAGLALSGLAWIDKLRESIRAMWHQQAEKANVVARKVRDLGVLAGLGVTVALSLGIAAIGTALTGWALARVGLTDSPVARVTLPVVSYALALVADTMLFTYLFFRLPRVTSPRGRVLRGALFGAAGFALLKLVGTVYIARTVRTGAEVYGTFAVVAGLLVWINLVSRFTLFAAAWTVTCDGDVDVQPSGTANTAEDPYPQDAPAPRDRPVNPTGDAREPVR